MTSQLSQPSSSISARVVGRYGAMPNRLAQKGRYENSGRAADIGATVRTPGGLFPAELCLLVADEGRLLVVGHPLGAFRGVVLRFHRDQALHGLGGPRA